MCGIVGIWGNPYTASLLKDAAFAQQHRGQESCGIAITDGDGIQHHKGMGLVEEVFTPERINSFFGFTGIAHVRYSTSGESILQNAQPHHDETKMGEIYLASNGNLVNAEKLYHWLVNQGKSFSSKNDGEVLVKLIGHFIDKGKDLIEAIQESMKMAIGSHSSVLITDKGQLAAFRDPYGFRPLVKGNIKSSKVFVSETCALEAVKANYEREVRPGEIILIERGNECSVQCDFCPQRTAKCIFELIYFSRPDSLVFGIGADKFRRQSGHWLAQEHPASADIVISIPDSPNFTALGYAEKSGIPFDFGMIRSHYTGRTFIMPRQEIRDDGVEKKYGFVKGVLKEKRVGAVDDSVVRGTTSKKIVQFLFAAGAKEVHLRIASPPIAHSCFYGIDTPDSNKLIANKHTLDEIRRFLGVNSLGYLSLGALREIVGKEKDTFCYACFNGEYPVL